MEVAENQKQFEGWHQLHAVLSQYLGGDDMRLNWFMVFTFNLQKTVISWDMTGAVRWIFSSLMVILAAINWRLCNWLQIGWLVLGQTNIKYLNKIDKDQIRWLSNNNMITCLTQINLMRVKFSQNQCHCQVYINLLQITMKFEVC